MNDQTPAPRRSQVKVQALPPLDVLDQKLILDPNTGVLTWRSSTGSCKAGQPAGSKDSGGYLKVRLNGSEYRYHRVVWKMFHREEPPPEVDHRNTIKTDNRPENLRDATREQNNSNVKRRRDNASGYKGIHWEKRDQRWRAQVKSNGKTWRAHFKSLDAAISAVRQMREAIHGHFTNHG